MTPNTQGAIPALLDEYTKVMVELQQVIKNITEKELITVVDNATQNPDCKSIQTILTHVVSAGYSYAIYIYELKKASNKKREKISRSTTLEYSKDLEEVLAYTRQTLSGFQDEELKITDAKKIKTQWGRVYDIEQLMEHAIVHILRHRRQIEKFKLLLKNKQTNLQ